MGILYPLDHPFKWDFPLKTIHFGVTPIYGNLHVMGFPSFPMSFRSFSHPKGSVLGVQEAQAQDIRVFSELQAIFVLELGQDIWKLSKLGRFLTFTRYRCPLP